MVRILQYAVTESSGVDSLTQDTIQEKHVIVTDEPVSIEWISRHPATPKMNTEYNAHPGFWFESIEPRRAGKLVWELNVKASTFQFDPIPESPLDEAADISADSELVSEPTFFDWKGRPITTTAGEWIPGINAERVGVIYRITKNLPADPVWLESYGGAVNSDAVRIRGRLRPPRSLMVRAFSLGPFQTKNRVRFTTVVIGIHYKPDLWIHRIWNRGTLQLVEFKTDKGKKAWKQARIMQGTPRQPVDDPVPLDASGKPIAGILDPTGKTPIDFSRMVVLSVQTQVELPFSNVLPLR